MFHSKNVNFCFHIYVMNNKKYDFHKKQKKRGTKRLFKLLVGLIKKITNNSKKLINE